MHANSKHLDYFALPDSADALQAQIEALEARLISMGLDGDCAYERAMSKVYDGLLRDRRRRLQAMRATGV